MQFSFSKFAVINSLIFITATLANTTNAQTIVNLQKRSTAFSMDGGNGGENRRQIYLWNTNLNNVNQQWEEINRGGGFFSYRKMNTNFCIDGGNGGARGQAVILFTCNSGNRNQHWEKIQLGNNTRLKKRGFSFSIDGNNGAQRRQVLHLWNSQDSNINQHWFFNNINNSSSGGSSSNNDFGLNPNREPWENFDLDDWALDAPNEDPDDGLSARTTDRDFINGDLFPGSEPYFFTGSDGAMVFRSNVGGARTSNNTSFPRSELREMLRRGNTSVSTTGVNRNNWVLGYQPNNLDFEDDDRVGGRNGHLRVTMRVNRVTTTGSGLHPGRVIIGQIHADDDEPVRLYYRKLPNNSRGSIYFSHQRRNGSDIDDINLIGSERSSQSNPSNGFELGELFSYEIINDDNIVEVIIRDGDRNGPIVARGSVNMDDEDSNYDRDDEWMYFKAGAYTQNNTGSNSDFDEVAIYRLDNDHD